MTDDGPFKLTASTKATWFDRLPVVKSRSKETMASENTATKYTFLLSGETATLYA